jgi:hypothetical protein
MSTIINTRSPFYKKISNASLFSAKLELSIWTGETSDKTSADKKYTLKKQAIGSNTYVTFELSKLIRDYMITEYNNYATDTLWIETVVVIYNSSGGTVSTTTTNYLAIDGYGYFENGINPRSTEYTTPMVLQDNTSIYYNDGSDIKIPIYAEAATVTAVLDTDAGANVNWNEANVFWEAYDVTWGDGDEDQEITDDGNTNQKIQYLILTDTEYLSDGDTVTISSDSSDYPDDIIITLRKVCEPKFTPLNIIFYNKYGALQNLWFFKKSETNINITSETFRNNIIDFDNSGGSPTYSLSKHQEKKFIANGKESITVNTGFYPEDHNEIVRQMMLAEQVWVYDGTNTLPINLKSNSLRFKKSVNDKLISYTVQFDYAFDKINNIQ